MEKNDCRTIAGASFGVSNIKQTGVGASAFAELSIPNWAAAIAIGAVLRKRRR